MTSPILEAYRIDDVAFGNLDDLHRWNQASPGAFTRLVRPGTGRYDGDRWWIKDLNGKEHQLELDQVIEHADGTITAPTVGLDHGRWAP